MYRMLSKFIFMLCRIHILFLRFFRLLFRIWWAFYYSLAFAFLDLIYLARVILNGIVKSFKSMKYTLITLLFSFYLIFPWCCIVLSCAFFIITCFRCVFGSIYFFYIILLGPLKISKRAKSYRKKLLKYWRVYFSLLKTIEKEGFTFLLCRVLYICLLLLLYVLVISVWTLFVVLPLFFIYVFFDGLNAWLSISFEKIAELKIVKSFKKIITVVVPLLKDFILQLWRILLITLRKLRKFYKIFFPFFSRILRHFPLYFRKLFFPKIISVVYSFLFYVFRFSCNVLYYLLYFLRLIPWYSLYVIEAIIVYLLRLCVYYLSLILFYFWKFLWFPRFLVYLPFFRFRQFILICRIIILDIRVLFYKNKKKIFFALLKYRRD